MPDEARAIALYGRLHGVTRAALRDSFVKTGLKFAASPRKAAALALAHAAASACIGPGLALALPFPWDRDILSENALKRLAGLAPVPARPGGAVYGPGEIARLSGLPEAACRTLALFDVLAPEGGPFTYRDLSAARQAAHLLARGVPPGAIVAAASTLGRRGLRLAEVRLGAAPWGELVQRFEGGIAGLDGQFALLLDEQAGDATRSFEAGLACEAEGAWEAAERHYARAERLDRGDPVIAFNRGNVLLALGRSPEAAIAFRRALAADPAFADAAFNLGGLYEAGGQGDQALAWYRAALEAHPSYGQALYNAARLLTAAGAYGEALPLWERFVATHPGDPDSGRARRLALLCRLGG